MLSPAHSPPSPQLLWQGSRWGSTAPSRNVGLILPVLHPRGATAPARCRAGTGCDPGAAPPSGAPMRWGAQDRGTGIGTQSHLRGHICWRSHMGTRAQQARGVLQAPGPLPSTAQRSARGCSWLGTGVQHKGSPGGEQQHLVLQHRTWQGWDLSPWKASQLLLRPRDPSTSAGEQGARVPYTHATQAQVVRSPCRQSRTAPGFVPASPSAPLIPVLTASHRDTARARPTSRTQHGTRMPWAPQPSRCCYRDGTAQPWHQEKNPALVLSSPSRPAGRVQLLRSHELS